MASERMEIIKDIWNKIHENFVPVFSWRFHPDMAYWYNDVNDTIECDCGLSMPIILIDGELDERNLQKLIKEMEFQIYEDYRSMGWDIGWFPD